MKKIVLILFASLIVEAVYADQRLWDLRPGVSCDKIPAAEQRLGSLEVAVSDAAGISKYTGAVAGKQASISYRCDKGLLSEQTIIVTSTTRDEAYRFANDQKTELAKRLGNPIHDGLELGILKKLFFAFMGADLDYLTRVVVWGRANEDVILVIKRAGANQWEVSISQGGSKLEYILNS